MGDFGPGKPKKPKARRLRFLDFRKKGRGILPPKPKSKPIKPTAKGGLPKPTPVPKPASATTSSSKDPVPKTTRVNISTQTCQKQYTKTFTICCSSVGKAPGAPYNHRKKTSARKLLEQKAPKKVAKLNYWYPDPVI